jgi:homoserine kinase type II
MTTVFIVQHGYEDDAGCEEVKFIGVYSSEASAQAAVGRLRSQPGFRDRPGDFYIDPYVLDQDHWSDGYVIGDPYEQPPN